MMGWFDWFCVGVLVGAIIITGLLRAVMVIGVV